MELLDSDVEPFYAYGFAHYNAGSLKEAADVFRLLCTRRPLEGRFWFGLGAVLQEAAHFQEAVEAWAMSSLLNPGDPLPHYYAAECYFSMDNREEGLVALQEAERYMDEEHPLREKLLVLKERWQ